MSLYHAKNALRALHARDMLGGQKEILVMVLEYLDKEEAREVREAKRDEKVCKILSTIIDICSYSRDPADPLVSIGFHALKASELMGEVE